jgi:ribosomal protein S18 acetylase RimI-like enzyme
LGEEKMPGPYAIEPLNPSKHDRQAFDCGVEALNDYLRERAGQDMRRHAAGCWVLFHKDNPETVLGYYTLSPESVDIRELEAASPALLRKLPRYPHLGAILLGRLAVDQSQRGKGFGEMLLDDAMLRALHAEIPSVLMVTDPKDEQAEAFYRKYGFERLNATRFFTTMQRISDTLGSRGSHR